MDGLLRGWTHSVAQQYGRRQGLLRHHAAQLLRAVGGLRDFEVIDWSRVKRLVFVCQGNVCRSPYGEARARALAIDAASFGLAARPGDPAHGPAVREAMRRGLDLGSHCARTAADLRLGAYDLL